MQMPGLLTALKLLTKVLTSWETQLQRQNDLLQRLADRFAPPLEEGEVAPDVLDTDDEKQAIEEFKEKLRAAGYDLEAINRG